MAIGLSFFGFVVAVSLLTLTAAISIAVRPRERTLAFFRPLSTCTVMAIVSSTAAGLGLALARGAEASAAQWSPEMTERLLAGLAESMVPAVLGFAVLAVSWLLVAFGFRRQA